MNTVNPSKPVRILMVDDDPDQRDLMTEVLRAHFGAAGGACITAVGLAADALRQDIGQFDIVLLDYNLPDMQGVDLLPQVLARADVPVVFVTGQNVATIAAEAIRRGAQDYVIKMGDYLFALPVIIEKNLRLHEIKRENQLLQRRLEEMLGELQSKNSQLEDSLGKLRTMAETDHLTGLANRRRFGQILESCHSDAQRYGHDLACCMCDLDHYKQLNDTLGHQVGDEVLQIAAQTIRQSLRTSDAAARYGGDEFVILLPHASVELAMTVGERIRTDLALSAQAFGRLNRRVTMSIGVASLRADHPASGDALVSMADRALYVAKERGKNRIVAFSDVFAPQQTDP